ncbi:MAG: ABC transporter permease, partial [Rhodospirillales bacterium]|nr:ABC transporter permease [Rhodospirillales bacterium]
RGDVIDLGGWRTGLLTISGLKALIMPAITLGLFQMTLIMRLVRAEMLEVLRTDYIKFARAKGISQNRIIFVHLMKNILIPVVTVLGLEFGGLIAFSVVTETVFSWPGMGKLIIDALHNLDRPVVVAYLMIIVLIFVVINLVVDVLYSILDPRVRLQDLKG